MRGEVKDRRSKMKDSRMMDFIRERMKEAALDLRSSCASVADTEIFQGMDEDTLFGLIADADRMITYALDLIAAKRLLYAVDSFRDLQRDEKILSEASSMANRRMSLCDDIYRSQAVTHEIELIDRVRHEVIMKNEE